MIWDMAHSHIHGKDLWKEQAVIMVTLKSGRYEYQIVTYDKGLPVESSGKDFI